MNTARKGAVGIVASAALIATSAGMGAVAASEDQDRVSITIATGRIGGLYHPVGGAICTLVNERTEEHGITCTVEIGGGSISNLELLRDGKASLAMVQSNWHYDAFRGSGSFQEAGPFKHMRSVFALYVEGVTIVARRDTNIARFEDLRGKRIYTGPPQVGRRKSTFHLLMKAEGWPAEEVTEVSEFEAANLAQALCDSEFDAFYYTVGHPDPMVAEATATCDAVLIPLAGIATENLINEKPYYVSTVIPAETYQGNHRDVATLGLVASLVTTVEVSPAVIYQITKAFFANLDRFREGSPVFSSLRPEDMVTVGLSAPLHEGALSYFSEVGLK
jgi:uncharacterized protein